MNARATTFQSLKLERQLIAAERCLGQDDHESADHELGLIPEMYRTDPRFVMLAARIRAARAAAADPIQESLAGNVAPVLLAMWVNQAYGLQAYAPPVTSVFLHTQS
jgi:hypothetical protein